MGATLMVLPRAITLSTMLVVASASTALAGTAPSDRPWSLIAATGSPGGTYYEYGQALAKLLSRILNLRVVTQATLGARENIQLIEDGNAQLGFVPMGIALEAWNGSGDWAHGRQYRRMRALFPMYETRFQFVALKSANILSLADMSGKRIGVGPKTGTGATYIPRFLSTLNIDATLSYGTWDDLAVQLERGEVDGLAVVGSVPFPAILGLEEQHQIRYISPTSEEISKLRVTFPELIDTEIRPGTYPSLLARYQTVGFYNFAVADKDLPSDLVYDIVDAVFTHHRELVDTDPRAAASVPENMVQNTFLPYHEGALRYYTKLAGEGMLERALAFLQRFTVTVSRFQISPVTVVVGLLWLALLWRLASWTAHILAARVLHHSRLIPSAQLLLSRVAKVVLITAAVLVSFGMMGVDLTALAVFTGAAGVGIGFGLQAIFNNFVAGLILLSEKSLKVGDYVDLERGLGGTVRQINIRNTTITTPLNVDVVVPNSEFVNGRVTNWTMLDPHARIRIPFGVAYGTDCDFLRKVLLEAADNVEYTLKDDTDRKTQLWRQIRGVPARIRPRRVVDNRRPSPTGGRARRLLLGHLRRTAYARHRTPAATA
jgi:TRAP transporter TAXI family solute receptor